MYRTCVFLYCMKLLHLHVLLNPKAVIENLLSLSKKMGSSQEVPDAKIRLYWARQLIHDAQHLTTLCLKQLYNYTP